MRDRRFDLVIFDCDGVLVDSEAIINLAHAQVPDQRVPDATKSRARSPLSLCSHQPLMNDPG
jgi:beta-phosphoglucomutase-like phosphatase (HAD superfamily)